MAYYPDIPMLSDQIDEDLAKMRANFAQLAPLAERVDDLEALTPLAPYVDALTSSRIVEMGSNANGHYVRWANGLQVCWKKGLILSEPSGGQGDYLENNWFFPSSFVQPPYVGEILIDAFYFNGTALSDRELMRQVVGMTNREPGSSSRTHVRLWVMDSIFTGVEETMQADVFAIGMWK